MASNTVQTAAHTSDANRAALPFSGTQRSAGTAVLPQAQSSFEFDATQGSPTVSGSGIVIAALGCMRIGLGLPWLIPESFVSICLLTETSPTLAPVVARHDVLAGVAVLLMPTAIIAQRPTF